LDETLYDAVYSALFLRADRRAWTCVYRSKLKGAAQGRPLLVYMPYHLLRVPFEILFRFRAFNTFVWWCCFQLHRHPKRYVNRLTDFTFFMDGNGRAKRFASRVGIDLKTLQQTFVIPSDFSSKERISETKAALASWLTEAARVFDKHGIAPTFQDVVWLPRDLAFPLSTTAASGGFAVSYAFDTNMKSRRNSAEKALKELSERLAERRGRVYLVKNVYTAPEVLRRMYGEDVERFLELKRRIDPDRVLLNRFFDEKLDAPAPGGVQPQ
jgi:D-arabinono-1,4-lactone oxidase